MKSYVKGLLNPACVPIRVSINKLNFVPERIVPGQITLLWNSGQLCSSKLCVLIVFLNLFKYRSSCLSNVYLITIAGNLVDYPHLVFLERHRLVSDVRTVCMPCCCRQRRRVSDSPFTYGSTTVDLISGAGSFGDIHFSGLVTFFKKENG